MKRFFPITIKSAAARLGLLVAGMAFLGGGCQKASGDEELNTATRTQLLTTGSWKLVAHTFDPAVDLDGDGQADDTDYYQYYEPCEKDDFITFHTDESGTIDEGPLKCDAGDPQTYDMSWNWNNDETVLYANGQQITIIELTSTTMKGTVTENFSGTTQVTMTLTFKH
ncbi:DUF5004 domain-containing protein [Flavihumibacter petaseus]|uniref:Lipocalin-like domain-containing protein n=1 Tax=Flavihumibacter petaseus NBRC 106054 TaxID=1220578 RepID=A0A0E9MY65_9BACT|nr:lipocalin family protein [Flavihumibacter petaseus]GAO42438.1 hypothetical protein FPE01S_01_14530 [Flavihumibacter petaseus NBRC 106054]